MKQRRWTLVLVPPGAGESRSLRVSLFGLRLTLIVAAVLAIVAVALGYTAVSKAVALSRLDRLERRNELLSQELGRARETMARVTASIDTIARHDSLVRVLAGLEPTDPEVQRAGIGGPVGAWTEDEQILYEGPTGRAALDFRDDLSTLLRRASMLATSFDVAAESLSTRVDFLKRYPSILPTHGWETSLFSEARMHPIYHEELPHEGIDIAAPAGTPIFAAADGVVSRVFNNSGYGLMIVIDHGSGYRTRYAHCSKATVSAGVRVKRGDKIGEVGSSGIATAPHLHYEVLRYGKALDPKDYILPKAIID